MTPQALNPDFVILYVADTMKSVAFYTRLLGAPPVEASPGFAMYALAPGRMLGLWAREGVHPPAGTPGGSELACTVPDAATVSAVHAQWREAGIPIAQAPTAMDFGFTFTALDPDGHRVRVFAPAG